MPDSIITIPQDHFSDLQPPYRETCTGPQKCLLCKLTGYHNHTAQSKAGLAKQAAIGFLVLIILGFILLVALFMVLRMVRVLA